MRARSARRRWTGFRTRPRAAMSAAAKSTRAGCEAVFDRTAPTEVTRLMRTERAGMTGIAATPALIDAGATGTGTEPGPDVEVMATTTDSAESQADGQATTATSAREPTAAHANRRALSRRTDQVILRLFTGTPVPTARAGTQHRRCRARSTPGAQARPGSQR